MERGGNIDLWKSLNRKWALLIIKQFISDKPRRFRDLLKILNGISSRTLTGRLRESKEAGLLTRRMYFEIPPKVEYTLTKKGEDLRKIITKIEYLVMAWRRARLQSFKTI